ncbi:MAG TPA: kelch repeat-containing protein [Polyangiaceae bacterium]|nr:kelch repeat-containing protein [Polyangiaceae bacterium]
MTGRLPRAFPLVLLAVACAPARSSIAEHRQRTAAERAADVSVPVLADSETQIRERASGLRVAVSLAGAKAVRAKTSGDGVRYGKAAPYEGDVVVKPTLSGAEDFVAFPTRPAKEELVYRADVSDAAGLRLVGNVLELLDEAGTPRLRMSAPYVVDRRGRRVEARVSLDDCHADTSGRAPWGRPVTAPGKPRCNVRVAWSGEARVEYPAVLDPSWTSTKGNMVAARRAHTATLLGDGTVLIVGGASDASDSATYLSSAELFDPKTNTFAATGSLSDPRGEHVAVLLTNGHVVVAAGRNAAGPLSSAEVYDGGKFHGVAPLQAPRTQAQATLLGDGAAMVAGGLDATNTVVATVELFDATSEKWTLAAPMARKRIGHYVTTLSNDGSGLAVAGRITTTLADLAQAEIYTPVTNKWTATDSLSETRYDFGGATLPDGRVLVAGGYNTIKSAPTDGAEIYDPGKLTWSKAGTLSTARSDLTLTALPGGLAVAAGGVVRDAQADITSYLKSVEVYDPTANTWSALPEMKQARYGHTATALSDGRVLVAGGSAGQAAFATAELLTLDANGATCKTGTTCGSGFCVDGVCCDTACDTSCNGCVRTATGKADGTCAVALAGQDPHGDCKDDGAPSCKMDGLCDGKGACESYASSRCTPNACKTNDDCTSGFCADGVCCDTACDGKCEACTKAKKGSGGDGTCGPVAKSTDPDGDCGTMGSGVCKGASTCDGAGACQVSTKGKACASAKCADAVTLAAAASCGGDGDCTPDTTDCTPFLCDAKAVACTTSCGSDDDCAPGAKCMNGLCAKAENGSACAKAIECSSGFCADGFCCDQACDGQCEACDASGMEGACKPVTGAPKNGRPACDGTGDCAGSCDGAMTDMCDYPHADHTCDGAAPNSCSDGMETVNRCNGLGACVASPSACAPYGCGKDACKTSCKSDADCQDGVHCDTSGACTPGIPLSCTNDHTMTTVTGGTHDCGAYRCVRGSCNTSCKADSDCADGAKCQSGKCQGGGGGGSGCELGAGGGTSNSAIFAVLSLLFARLRRKRAFSENGASTPRSLWS